MFRSHGLGGTGLDGTRHWKYGISQLCDHATSHAAGPSPRATAPGGAVYAHCKVLGPLLLWSNGCTGTCRPLASCCPWPAGNGHFGLLLLRQVEEVARAMLVVDIEEATAAAAVDSGTFLSPNSPTSEIPASLTNLWSKGHRLWVLDNRQLKLAAAAKA